MSGKDLLKLLLIVFGFNEGVKIITYKAEGGYVGYDVSASNSYGFHYHEADCEGLLFHMYEIISYMNKNEIRPTTITGEYSIKDILKMTSSELEKLPIVNRLGMNKCSSDNMEEITNN